MNDITDNDWQMLLNSNIRCIEMYGKIIERLRSEQLNSNIRCIEIAILYHL